MAVVFDPETIARLKTMTPREAYEEIKTALLRMGAGGSEEFLEACEALVEEGILTWADLEEFER
jgi:hypothetical protein